ncbi:MAG: cyclodeaminase/cyclohydrolase family protein [Thermoleophilia bacterium]|nr:cyclodeaminase/cyclohydrolase family protein [Thermoleophilia bacterium]
MGVYAFLQGTIQSYLDRLASEEPAPGGGSAAALAGALAAALVTMVTNLTLGREKFASVEAEMSELKVRAEELRAELTRLVEQDAEAYSEVAAAFKLPRNTEEEKKKRHETLQAALVNAAAVPLRVAEAALEVARLCAPAADKGNPNAVSDAGVAVVLAEAAAQAAALNVKINLAWLEDKEFVDKTWSRVQEILEDAATLRTQVLSATYDRIG